MVSPRRDLPAPALQPYGGSYAMMDGDSALRDMDTKLLQRLWLRMLDMRVRKASGCAPPACLREPDDFRLRARCHTTQIPESRISKREMRKSLQQFQPLHLKARGLNPAQQCAYQSYSPV